MNDIQQAAVQTTLEQLFEVLTESRSDLREVRRELIATRRIRFSKGETRLDPVSEMEELQRLKCIADASQGLAKAHRLAYQAASQLEEETT